MSVFENILSFLQTKADAPTNYSPFHIFFCILTIVVTVLLVWKFHNASDKTMRKILLVFWIVLVVFEIYKQIAFSFTVTDEGIHSQFLWYSLPFQFCSTPFYALPFAIFLKDGWLRKSFIVFLSGFTFFAGLVVMIYPNDVFTPMIGVSVQTMIHHGIQVCAGILLMVHSLKNTKISNFFGSLMIFACFCAIAMILNETVHSMIIAQGVEDSINMFFISPYYDCTLPVLCDVYKAVPYPAFLAIYLFGFSIIAAIFYSAQKGIIKLASKKKVTSSETDNA